MGYIDSDWGGDVETRKSTGGYIYIFIYLFIFILEQEHSYGHKKATSCSIINYRN